MVKVILITRAMNNKSVLKRLLVFVAIVQLFHITMNGQVCEPVFKFATKDTVIIIYADDILTIDTIEKYIVLKEQASEILKKKQFFFTEIYYYNKKFCYWQRMGVQHILDSNECKYSSFFLVRTSFIREKTIINNDTLFYDGLPAFSP